MARNTRRWLLALALASLVVLAGCSGSGGDAASKATVDDATASEGARTQSAASGTSTPEFEGQNAQMGQRALIRTGTVEVRVDDYDAARRNLTRETRRLGGFVSDSAEQVHTDANRSWTTGKLVLRVPKNNFSALLSRAKRAGEVRDASTSAKDVTKQLVDVEARLENLKAQRGKLRELYREANDTDTVLDVQERLSAVQSEIERLEARRKSLRRKVAYSTIRVRLNERPPERDGPGDAGSSWYDTGPLAAFLASVEGVAVVARGLAVGLAYAAPYALAFGVPVGGAVAVWRRRRSDESAGASLPDPPESSPDEEE